MPLLLGRRAILDKLAAVPVSSFDEADLGQLYQALTLLDHPSAPPRPGTACSLAEECVFTEVAGGHAAS